MSVETVQPEESRAGGFGSAPERLDELVRKLVGGVPPLLGAARQDLELHFRRVLQEQLVRLDLCSRSEFDTQARVLIRTQQRIAELEARIVVLEQRPRGAGAAP